MNLLSVKPSTIPIPLHKHLEVLAIVDVPDPRTKRLLDHNRCDRGEDGIRFYTYVVRG